MLYSLDIVCSVFWTLAIAFFCVLIFFYYRKKEAKLQGLRFPLQIRPSQSCILLFKRTADNLNQTIQSSKSWDESDCNNLTKKFGKCIERNVAIRIYIYIYNTFTPGTIEKN